MTLANRILKYVGALALVVLLLGASPGLYTGSVVIPATGTFTASAPLTANAGINATSINTTSNSIIDFISFLNGNTINAPSTTQLQLSFYSGTGGIGFGNGTGSIVASVSSSGVFNGTGYTGGPISGTTGTFTGPITNTAGSPTSNFWSAGFGGAVAVGGTSCSTIGAVCAGGPITGASYSGGTVSGTTGAFTGAITGASYTGGPISGTTGTFAGAITNTSGSPTSAFWSAGFGGAVSIGSGSCSIAGTLCASGAITGASYTGGPISGTTGTFSGAITGTGYSGGPISGTTGTFAGAITNTSGSPTSAFWSAGFGGAVSIGSGSCSIAGTLCASGNISAATFSGDGSQLIGATITTDGATTSGNTTTNGSITLPNSGGTWRIRASTTTGASANINLVVGLSSGTCTSVTSVGGTVSGTNNGSNVSAIYRCTAAANQTLTFTFTTSYGGAGTENTAAGIYEITAIRIT